MFPTLSQEIVKMCAPWLRFNKINVLLLHEGQVFCLFPNPWPCRHEKHDDALARWLSWFVDSVPRQVQSQVGAHTDCS